MNFAESEKEFDSMDDFTGITTESFIERVHRIPPQFTLRIHFAGKRKSPLARGNTSYRLTNGLSPTIVDEDGKLLKHSGAAAGVLIGKLPRENVS